MSGQSYLIVNADDFGRSDGVNRGVIKAHEHGIVSSASLTVRWPSSVEAAQYCREHAVFSSGIHFDFGEWIYRNDTWVWIHGLVDLSDPTAAAKEVSRQLEAFHDLVGRAPTHIDSHQHVHRSDPVLSILLTLAEQLGVPLRYHSPLVSYCGDFYGQTSKGLPFPAGIRADTLIQILAKLPSGFTELRCHPGEGDDCDAMYGKERSEETNTLCDPRVRAAIAKGNIRLCSYTNVRSDSVTWEPVARSSSFQRPTEIRRGQTDFILDDPMVQWSAIERLEDGVVDQQLLIRTAEGLWGHGHLQAARRAFERSIARCADDVAVTRSYRELIGEMEVLEGSWTPPALHLPRFNPIRGRVLHIVTNSLPYSLVGYAVRTHYVAKAQLMTGLEPHVVTPLGYPWSQNVLHATSQDDVDLVPYHRLLPAEGVPATFAERLSLHFIKLADLMRDIRPAVLHAASDYPNAMLAVELGRFFGLPLVYEVRGFWEETWLSKMGPTAAASEKYEWWKVRELECMLAADRVVTLAQVMKDQIVKRGVPAEKIVLIPNGVDNMMLGPIPGDPAVAQQLGICQGEVVVGYISTFSRYEGIPFLLEAVAKLIKRGHPIRVLLVGDGQERTQLETYAASLGISERIRFAGRVPHADILRYYGLIDIFVVPRTADRVSQFVTPLKPFEAMAAGCAVIVSGVPALEEVVQNGMTGLVFTPEDSHDLARVVESLIVNPERRRELGQRAREWVRSHRTWDKIGQLYLEMYQAMGVT